MSQPEALTPWLKQALIQLIADRTGFKIRDNDQAAFAGIITKRTQRLGLIFPENYYQLLEEKTNQSNQEWKQLIPEITNTESFFFRDKGQFKLLENSILPDLIHYKSANKTLRICSAGCSTGEEPYSLAILLKRLIPHITEWDLTILGVDINSVAINKAKTGLYRPWSFRGLDEVIKQTFFEEINGYYYIDKSVKDMVKFQTVNLLEDAFPENDSELREMDLILCRNVFIYFDKSAIKTILDKFYNALNPLGYLLVGHAELYSQKLLPFQVRVFEESIAYQRPADDLADAIPKSDQTPLIPHSTQTATSEIMSSSSEQLFEENDIKMKKVALNLLRQLPADTRIARQGNLTASELILKIEKSLKETN